MYKNDKSMAIVTYEEREENWTEDRYMDREYTLILPVMLYFLSWQQLHGWSV
jgi:hypothetical protein